MDNIIITKISWLVNDCFPSPSSSFLVLAQKVQEFMKTKQFDQAFDEVGGFVLDEIRRAILVNFAAQKILEPKP